MSTYSELKMQLKVAMKAFEQDERADSGLVKLILGVFILAILGGALLPTGIDSLIAGSNTSGTWSSAETTTYGAITIMIIVAVVAGVAGLIYKAID